MAGRLEFQKVLYPKIKYFRKGETVYIDKFISFYYYFLMNGNTEPF